MAWVMLWRGRRTANLDGPLRAPAHEPCGSGRRNGLSNNETAMKLRPFNSEVQRADFWR